MPHGVHYVEKCKFCRSVVSQCRCSAASKPIRWAVCGECAARIADGDDPTPVEHPPR